MKFPPPFYRWRPHPWHGLEVGPDAPKIVHAYIEITPFDVVKYEIDKTTGYLRVDRPQRSSSQPPQTVAPFGNHRAAQSSFTKFGYSTNWLEFRQAEPLIVPDRTKGSDLAFRRQHDQIKFRDEGWRLP